MTLPEGSSKSAGGPSGRRPSVCPSTSCAEGTSLLGVTTASGRLAYLPDPVVVDRALADRLQASGRPESRYRFTGPCREEGCAQWTGRRCAVVDHILDDPPDPDPGHGPRRPETSTGGALPVCGIRADCRWFAQRGAAACRVCPSVVADVGGSATYRSARPDQSP